MPFEELEVQTEDMTIVNISSLPLNATLAVPYPFTMVVDKEEGEVNQSVRLQYPTPSLC